jgi:ribonuclease Z
MPHRGVSSVALFRDGELYLFDCGESTQIQLSRSSLRPGALKSIFLTHFHGDHVNGVPGFLGSLTLNQRREPLAVHGPEGLSEWFACLKNLQILWPSFKIHAREILEPGEVASGDNYRVLARPLDHRVTTWGYAFIEDDRPGRFDVDAARDLGVPAGPLFGRLQQGETVELDDGTTVEPSDVLGPARPGLKIAYCTDTVPCDSARELAENADVLIHEATYPAGKERKAHNRGHSTAADAARCAKESGAKKLILTHISQKYTNLEEFVAPARDIFENTVIAHDLMEVPIKRREH